MGNTFGKVFTVTTFGESHGIAIGAVVDGCPAGLVLSEADFCTDMERRRPGKTLTSGRKEDDYVSVLSGVFEGVTLGTPIALLIHNTDQRPQDYADLRHTFRPGHGDFTYATKYGHRDYRGGGRASGRETAARVAAGVIAKKILAELGVTIKAKVYSIGDIPLGDRVSQRDAVELLKNAKNTGTSVSSSVVCKISGLKAGVGQPVFDKLNAELAKAVMSIGGARSVKFTSGHNDGILAGISSGQEIYMKVNFKPPASVGEVAKKGRHDPAIAPRGVVVVEAMAAIVLVDQIFRGFSSRLDNVKKIW
ncbi:MAG: chorismate synthase [Defluviitaleaceae bacterium]|nr:chorismate synthase [Defluviitaleaceae bacterium]